MLRYLVDMGNIYWVVSFDTNTEAGTTAAQGPRVTSVVAEQNKRDDVDDVICKHSFAHLDSSHYHITEW